MSLASELFTHLQTFKNGADGKTAQELLLEYCKETLGAIERFHFDYKEKDDRRGAKLGDSDKRNLAKAVSGFANAGGGVLIWGIEDQTLNPKPIKNVERFIANIMQLSVQITDPPVQEIDGDFLRADDSDSEGFAFLYIPESNLPPHRVILNNPKVKDRYFQRSAESFPVSSHTQLEDMFGRRPKAKISIATRIIRRGGSTLKMTFAVVFSFINNGRGVAKSPYVILNFETSSDMSRLKLLNHGSSQHITFKRIVAMGATAKQMIVSTSDVPIYTGTSLDFAMIEFEVQNSSSSQEFEDTNVVYTAFADGISPTEGTLLISGCAKYEYAMSVFRDFNG